jgi:hypothetical protein
MLPNLLVIGAAKAGTTSLYHYLRAHPDIFMSEKKELSFFVDDYNWGRGLSWYERQFDAADGAKIRGEASPRYTVYPEYPDVPRRIRDSLPDVRLIYSLRQPIDRMRAHYLDRRNHGREDRPIDRALTEDGFYINGSRYALQIEQYLGFFPRDQLLLIDARNLLKERATTMRMVYEFVGVDPNSHLPELEGEYLKGEQRRVPRARTQGFMASRVYRGLARVVPRPVKEKLVRPAMTRPMDRSRAEISDDLRERLEEELRDDVARLKLYLGEDFDGWGLV